MGDVIERIVLPKAKDVGGFEVSRALPSRDLRTVGPFVFWDEMGPGLFAPGEGLDVRPHPHIGLATVTYLFDGGILHRDSLGTVQEIVPGDVNWMTAGRGIVHSERTGPELRSRGHRLHGIQAWVGLPSELEETAPRFDHHPAATLPEWLDDDVTLRLVAGTYVRRTSPVEVASPTVYVHLEMPAGSVHGIPAEHEERALYVVFGGLDIAGERIPGGGLALLRPGAGAVVQAQGWTRALLLGGAPLDGERMLRWNFVASSSDAIEQAERDWTASAEGGFRGTRFELPPDETGHIPLPGIRSAGPPEACAECPTT
jgi:redox-sensitive bicupin YhaK (pirin superfamily)